MILSWFQCSVGFSVALRHLLDIGFCSVFLAIIAFYGIGGILEFGWFFAIIAFYSIGRIIFLVLLLDIGS